MRIQSLTQNIKRQTLAVLAMIEGLDVADHRFIGGYDENWKYFLRTETSTFYNGRENGICITFYSTGKAYGKVLVVVFGENRNSDNIFVTHWIQGSVFNPPTLNDQTEEAYEKRRYFNYGDIVGVADYIMELGARHFASLIKEEKGDQADE